MRDTIRYPVTLAEVAAELVQIAKEMTPGPDGPVGGMRPVLIMMAAKLLQNIDELLTDAPGNRPSIPIALNSVQSSAFILNTMKFEMSEMVSRNLK